MYAGGSIEIEVTVKDADGCVRYYGTKREALEDNKGAGVVAARLAQEALREAEHRPNRERARKAA